MSGKTDYRCPWCGARLYPWRPLVPVVGECGQCRKSVRLVGPRFVTWAEWLQIRNRREYQLGIPSDPLVELVLQEVV